MSSIPPLDDDARRVLEVLLDRGNLPGYELMRQASVAPDKLIGAVAELRRQDLVQVSGDVSNAKMFPFATLAVRPSAKEYAYNLARQRPM